MYITAESEKEVLGDVNFYLYDTTANEKLEIRDQSIPSILTAIMQEPLEHRDLQ